MYDLAIQTKDLTKRYGRRIALDRLSLEVPRGSVFAFLGMNGAGKTTTIRILLDILDRSSGEASVLGYDCIRDSIKIKERTGYVAEGQSMYDWMQVDEIIKFCSSFYPGWDHSFADTLKRRFELPGDMKVGALSRGMRGKLALLLAMAFRPELLLLDEPTAGLDVVVRHDFLKSILDLIQEEGRTVFFSSHHVSEVERIADWVGIVDKGRLIHCSPTEELKRSVRRVIFTLESGVPLLNAVPGAIRTKSAGRQWALTVKDFSERTVATVRNLGAADIVVEDMSLEHIFIDLVEEDSRAPR